MRRRKAPGVAQVSTSFLVIFFLYGLVIPLVIGLFFLIVTLQKARSLTLLRAIGARSSTLGARRSWRRCSSWWGSASRSARCCSCRSRSMRVGSIPLSFDAVAVAAWALGILVLGVAQLVVLGATGAAHRSDRSPVRRIGAVKLALREMRRRPGRFATAAVLLTLIAMLLMLLGGLLDGLIARSTGAIEAQRADLMVFSATAEKSFLRSRITPEIRAQVAAVPGVTGVGGIGVAQLGARVPGKARATSPTSRSSATRRRRRGCPRRRRPAGIRRQRPEATMACSGARRCSSARPAHRWRSSASSTT